MSRSPSPLLVVFALVAACGARTALDDRALGDGGLPDAAPVDAPVDASVDAPDAPRCVPTEERCNGRDDDCDGLVDEDLPYQPIAPAYALRTTEGDTGGGGACSSCRWVWDPSLVPTSTGWVVPFRLGIYGGREQPSLFLRATDADGAGLGTVNTVGTAVPLRLRRWDMPGPDGATWLDAIVRVGTSDLAGWVAIDAAGQTRVLVQNDAITRSPSITLGPSVLVATAAGINVRVDQHLVRGTEVRTTSRQVLIPDIAQGGLTSLGLAVSPQGDGAVLFVARFVASPRSFRMWTQRLGPSGEPVGAAALLLDAEAPLTFLAATTDGGYLLFEPGNGGPATARFVDAALTRPGDPVVLAPGTRGSSLSFDSLRMPDGGWLVHTGTVLVRLDPRGRPLARWSGPLAPGDRESSVVSPDLNRRAGRTFITWHDVAASSTPNTLWIRELGCLPEP